MRVAAASLLLFLLLLPFFCSWTADTQDREHLLAAPNSIHWLGTDVVGRDNLARYALAARFSIFGGAAASAVAITIGAIIAVGFAALPERVAFLASACFDTMHAVPWYLMAFVLRAMVPLDTAPSRIAIITFCLLAGVGWVSTARVVASSLRQLRPAPWVRFPVSTGVSAGAVFVGHLLPNLWPILRAQFLLLLPAMLLAETSLGLVGLGIPEPLPSLGAAIAELIQPGWHWWNLIPFAVLSVSVLSVQALIGHIRPAPGNL